MGGGSGELFVPYFFCAVRLGKEETEPIPKKRTVKTEKKRNEIIEMRDREIKRRSNREQLQSVWETASQEQNGGTHRVEECLQVGKYIGLCLDAGMVMLEMDQVTFEAAEEIFSHGVVIGIAPAGGSIPNSV